MAFEEVAGPGELERPSDDPREATALLHNRAQLMAEATALRGRIEELERRCRESAQA